MMTTLMMILMMNPTTLSSLSFGSLVSLEEKRKAKGKVLNGCVIANLFVFALVCSKCCVGEYVGGSLFYCLCTKKMREEK